MYPETYRLLAEREDTYWWHIARRALSRRMLQQLGIPSGARWLDLGCGTGGNLRLSESFGADLTVGLDVSAIALATARRKEPTARLVAADLNDPLPFLDASFDVVTVFNVLYHDWIKDDVAVLTEVKRVLKAGGVVLNTEPAFAGLASNLDNAAMGRRRYRIADVVRLHQAAGLTAGRTSYFNSFSVPLLLANRLIGRVRPATNREHWEAAASIRSFGRTIDNILGWLSELESRAILAGMRVPVGTTLLCLSQRQPGS